MAVLLVAVALKVQAPDPWLASAAYSCCQARSAPNEMACFAAEPLHLVPHRPIARLKRQRTAAHEGEIIRDGDAQFRIGQVVGRRDVRKILRVDGRDGDLIAIGLGPAKGRDGTEPRREDVCVAQGQDAIAEIVLRVNAGQRRGIALEIVPIGEVAERNIVLIAEAVVQADQQLVILQVRIHRAADGIPVGSIRD